ncbi:uncharacterized protein LOC133825400 [Humulus lupulus]|uniref:uncharacterized protein LOC133825400 n=1 Tax=Humulus lupulus TaxID=3486 RepID=UPI002B409065|nr:uncharacterized protein LOC133825400 [Humulus lupulus]
MFLGDEISTSAPRVSVFERLEVGTSTPRVSTFERLEFPSISQPKAFRKKSLAVDEENSSSNSSEDFVDIIQPAPQEIEDGGQVTDDDLTELNLGTEDDPKPVFVSSLLSEEELQKYKQFLYEYKDVFAWGYQDMPSLDPNVAVHRLAVLKDVPPVKQSQRRIRPELISKIEAEIDKLIRVGFIREVKYPTWLANIVPVLKKNGQIRICVDYRDLNRACPKDEFPLPTTELLVDATTGFNALSFMDGFSGYNQIKMAPEDEELTTFRTPKGIYCYTVMPFGLKNAGATYQRAMATVFEDMLHNTIECYVDDLVVKTKERINHLDDLRRVFDRLRKHQLKMNPLKCAFEVTSGKFLGFVVRHRGIEIDPAKIKAILEMPPPHNLCQLRGLQGRLAYIRRFISNLSSRCQPFTRLMQKNVPFIWDKACQNAFESIKQYLSHPPVLRAPILGKSLILYITTLDRSLGALLAQNNEDGKEVALYYLSRTLAGAEHKYPPIEKVCLALIFAITKLRHYLLSHTVTLVSKADPLRYILSKPVLSGRLEKWSMILSEFEINFVPQKAIKGQALVDFLAMYPIPDNMELREDLPDEEVFTIETPSWQLYFDGAAKKCGAGAGIVFVTPSGGLIPYSFHIMAICTNNVAEYEALIIGLEIALEMQIQSLEVYGNSLLIIKQINGEFAVKHEALIPYHEKAKHLIAQFQNITLNHVPRSKNGKADALAKLVASLTLPGERDIQITIGECHLLPQIIDRKEEISTINLVTFRENTNDNDWRQPIINYIQKGVLPEDLKRRVDVKRRALRFVFLSDTLYKHSFDGMLLRCLSKEEASHALQETHAGTCGAHQASPKLSAQLKWLGYYWPTMVQDAINFAKCYYFSKWAEAIPLKEVRAEDVADFIRTQAIVKLMDKYKFKHSFSASYNPSSNGQAEAFNKVLCKIMKKTVTKNKRDWHKRLPEALWAYRTTIRTGTGCTPYNLVFGSEAVLPLEVQIPSLRISTQLTTPDENVQVRLAELEALDEK